MWHNLQQRKKLADSSIKRHFFRVWKKIKNYGERINLLERNINYATDLYKNRVADAIDTGCSIFSKNFSSYFFEW